MQTPTLNVPCRNPRSSEWGGCQITEMDVQMGGSGARAERLEKQAQVYREVLQICLRQPRCKVFTLWGFTDAHSWLSASEPLIFDADYRPKPAYFALQHTLQQP